MSTKDVTNSSETPYEPLYDASPAWLESLYTKIEENGTEFWHEHVDRNSGIQTISPLSWEGDISILGERFYHFVSRKDF